MNELNFVAIGSRIKKQREFLGYTREYLAEQISVSTNFCRDIEIGAKGMSIQTLIKVSSTLKLSLDYIVLGKSTDEDIESLSLMLKSCNKDKRKYAEDILKTFLLAIE